MKKVIRIIGIVCVVVLVFAAIIASTTSKPSTKELVWDETMTIGDLNAKNHFIVYSDIVCPYCVAFENILIENKENLRQYLDDNDILLEIRLTDFLHEYAENKPINSRYSAVSSYCAKKENKFWDYYDLAITTVWNDYFKENGKSAFDKLNSLDKSYWISLGKKIGLGDDFKTCVENDETLDEVIANTEKAAKLASGMPYLKFNKFASSGFGLSGTWSDVLMLFQAGLSS